MYDCVEDRSEGREGLPGSEEVLEFPDKLPKSTEPVGVRR